MDFLRVIFISMLIIDVTMMAKMSMDRYHSKPAPEKSANESFLLMSYPLMKRTLQMMVFSSSKCWGMSVLVWLVTFVVSASADMVSIQITDTFDDMEEWTAGERIGRLFSASTDLELGMEDIPPDRPEDTPQRVGLRFPAVEVPAGATINSAHIQFTVDEDDHTEDEPIVASLTFYGRNTADAPAFTHTEFVLTSITDLTSPVHWEDIPSWTGQVGLSGPDQRTSNLASIVEEIIGLDGWAVGNAIAFIIDPMVVGVDGNGDDIVSRGNRTAEAFDGSPSDAAVLTIDFTIGVPDPSADFDIDDDVDGRDFLSWQGGFGTLGGASKGQGDANDDGNVDAADLAIWQTQFGDLTPLSAVNGVPEPTAAILFALATLGLLGVRGRLAK